MSNFYLKMVAYGLRQKEWKNNLPFLQEIIDKNKLKLNYSNGGEFDFTLFFANPEKREFILNNGYEYKNHRYNEIFKKYFDVKEKTRPDLLEKNSEYKKLKEIFNFILKSYPKAVEEIMDWGIFQPRETLAFKMFQMLEGESLIEFKKPIHHLLENQPYLLERIYFSMFSKFNTVYNMERDYIEKWQKYFKDIYEQYPIEDKVLWECLEKVLDQEPNVFEYLIEWKILTPEKEKVMLAQNYKRISDIYIQTYLEKIEKSKKGSSGSIFKKLEYIEESLLKAGFAQSTYDVLGKLNSFLNPYEKEQDDYLAFIARWKIHQKEDYPKMKL